MWCLARADVAPSQKIVNLVPCQSNDFLNCTVYSFMTSFPLRVCCHSAADLISCVFGAVWAQLVIVVLKGRAAVNWDGEEALGLFVVSAAAHNGGLRILWIISRLCLHFFIQSFYVLAARDTQGKILLDTVSLFFFFFQPLLKMCCTDGQRWLRNQPWKTLAGFFLFCILTLRMKRMKLIWSWRWINKRWNVEIPSDIWRADRVLFPVLLSSSLLLFVCVWRRRRRHRRRLWAHSIEIPQHSTKLKQIVGKTRLRSSSAQTSEKIAITRGDLLVSLIYVDLCNHPRCVSEGPERIKMFAASAARTKTRWYKTLVA